MALLSFLPRAKSADAIRVQSGGQDLAAGSRISHCTLPQDRVSCPVNWTLKKLEDRARGSISTPKHVQGATALMDSFSCTSKGRDVTASSGMFDKAGVQQQPDLLHGRETWAVTVTEAMLRDLQGIHRRVVGRLSGLRPPYLS